MSRRKAAAAYVLAALIMLLIDLPKQVVIVDPPPPPTPAAGPCDNVWAVPGFTTRFMVYDKVVHNQSRMGPEVEGRVTSEVINELRERLCTDDALLADLSSYRIGGFNAAMNKAGRVANVKKIRIMDLDERNQRVRSILSSMEYGKPRLEKSNKAFTAWYHQAGKAFTDVPGLEYVTSPAQQSTFLVYQTKGKDERILRLECGFQPTKLL